MSTCPSRRQLWLFLNEKLEGEPAVAVAAHLDICADCQTACKGMDDEPAATVIGVSTTPPLEDAPGAKESVPGYERARLLATGGMGEVYLARDTRLKRTVALKTLRLDRIGLERRFLEEAQIAGQLQHPGIPPVHEVGELPDGRPFFAMKLVEGQTLAALLAERPSPGHELARFVGIFEQICQAVGYAHSRGVIHRDLKPANVMVGAFGEVQVMDWGLAKVVGATEGAIVETDRDGMETRAGSAMGTWAYMPPEQARGEAADERSDVFGLGAILCEVLTGQPPYVGEGKQDRATAGNVAEAVERLDRCGADAELVALAKRCLRAGEQSPAHAGELAAAVAAYRAGVEERLRRAETERAAAQVKAAEERKRRRVVLTGAVAIVVVLLGGIAGTAAGLIWAEARRKQEFHQRVRAENARARTWDVLDAMTSGITGNSLRGQRRLTQQQKDFLARVLTYYQEFAKDDADDEATRMRLAEAAFRVGRIEYLFGRYLLSTEAFTQAVDGYRVLVEENPESPDHRGGLADSQYNLGNALSEVGLEAEAEREYRKAASIYSGLATAHPTAPQFRLGQIGCCNGLCALLLRLSRTTEAEQAARDALAFHEQFSAAQPTAPNHPTVVATAHKNLGVVFFRTSRPAAAVEQFRIAIKILKGGKGTHSSDDEQPTELAPCYAGLGAALHSMGELAEAETQMRKGLSLYQKLRDDEPAIPKYQYEVARSGTNLGVILSARHKIKEAETNYREAQTIFIAMVKSEPASTEYQSSLADNRNKLGILLAFQNRLADSETELSEGVTICRKLVGAHPTVAEYRQKLGILYKNLANVLKMRKDGKAEKILLQVLETFRQLDNDFPTVPEYQSDLAGIHLNLGNHFAGIGRLDKAKAHYLASLATCQQLTKKLPDRTHHWDVMGRTHACLGNLLSQEEQLQEAGAELRKAMKIFKKLSANESADIECHLNLAKIGYNMGLLLERDKKSAEAEEAYSEALAAAKKRLADHPDLREVAASSAEKLRQFATGAGRTKDALRYAREIVTFEPRAAGSRLQLAHHLHEEGQPVAAINQLLEAISLKPTLPDGYAMLGQLLIVSGERQAGLSALRRAARDLRFRRVYEEALRDAQK